MHIENTKHGQKVKIIQKPVPVDELANEFIEDVIDYACEKYKNVIDKMSDEEVDAEYADKIDSDGISYEERSCGRLEFAKWKLKDKFEFDLLNFLQRSIL